jgi:hypothetical protein
MTLAGAHTVAELIDLVAAKDYVVNQTDKSYLSFQDSWKAQDSAAQSKWLSEWNLLKTRYGRARLLADTEIANAKIQPVPNTVIPAETAYTAILRSLQKTEGVTSPGDLQDLANRLANAGASLQFPKVPQPKSGSDVDLNTFNALRPFDVVSTVKENPITSVTLAIVLAASGFIGYGATKRKRP